MDRATIEIYDRIAVSYAARRRPVLEADARAFGARVPAGVWRADLGSGTGRYTGFLGTPVLALDASHAMLQQAAAGAGAQAGTSMSGGARVQAGTSTAGGARVQAGTSTAGGALVQADVEALPLRRGALGGAWANQCYQHVPRARLPLALAKLHDALCLGAPLRLSFAVPKDDDFPGRLFEQWTPSDLARVVVGAGFTVTSASGEAVEATRALTLPDIVGPGMRMLVCGLNPSVYAAERGVAFARPGNRFWPAAMAAGLVTRDRDPWDALASHGVGFTDLVKRATPQAAELTADEYRAGVARVAWLAAFLRPRVVCVVGLTGWRVAVDPRASPGWQPTGLGGAPVYLMPNPSGVNAHATLESLAAHLGAAAARSR